MRSLLRRVACLALGSLLLGLMFLGTRASGDPAPVRKGRPRVVTPASQPQPSAISSADTPPTDDRAQLAAEGLRVWKEANACAAKQDWSGAVQSGQRALTLQLKSSPDEPLETWSILDALCAWHTHLREFPEALAVARENRKRREKLLGPEHWRTVDARLSLELVERLSKLSDEQWRQFNTADDLQMQAAQLLREGNTVAALPKFEQALDIFTRVTGRDNVRTLGCLSSVIFCQLELAELKRARPLVQEIVELQPRVQGNLHPNTVQTLGLLARFNESAGALADAELAQRNRIAYLIMFHGPEQAEKDPETLGALVDLGRVLMEQSKFQEAEFLLQEAVRHQLNLFGEEDLSVAQSRKVLGTLYCRLRKYEVAKVCLEQSSEAFHKTLGDKHPAVASADNALGRLRAETGRLEQAETDLRNSLAICLATYGDLHPNTGKVLDNLAYLYEISGNTGLARRCRQHCLTIAEKTYGKSCRLTADLLVSLSRTYSAMNDYALAEPFLLRARETRRQMLGDDHPQTASVTGKLANVYLGAHQPQRAEPLFLEAIRNLERSPGDDPTEVAKLRKSLALLYQSEGRFDDAETQYRQILTQLDRDANGAQAVVHGVQVGLAQTLLSQGARTEASELMDLALNAYSKELSPESPEWIDVLGVGSQAYLATGQADKARSLLTRSLKIAKRRLQFDGSYESERQRISQMKMLRASLDLCLSLPVTEREDTGEVYPYVLAWKGVVASRQWHDRQCVSDELVPQNLELQKITRRLGTLSLHVPEVAKRKEWIGQIFSLTMRKEQLEEQRAMLCTQLRPAPSDVDVAALQQSLPADAALIDFLQYKHASFEGDEGTPMVQRPRYLAFVVRPGRAVQRVDLEDAEPIVEAVLKWRQTRGFRPDAGKTDWGAIVAERLLPSLRPLVDDCRTLLISPDGILSHLAWNALPGREPGSYLIEDFAIALTPVPQLLPAILADGTSPEGDSTERPSLLLVGNIDFDAAASAEGKAGAPADDGSHDGAREGEAPIENARPFHFSPLKGTAAEVYALRRNFERRFPEGDVTLLEQAAATEEAFWREAPRHRWLHVATHGFYAPPSIKSAMATQQRMDPNATPQQQTSVFHASFLNGLALAGANNGAIKEGDDGILTAAELSMLDLRHVDVAVLSGCETGLGEVQGGEGTFGMQRAMQLAGVGATVGSLWTVPDEKTNQLMQRFYSNLWDKKLSRLAALREAQLEMLNSGGGASSAAGKPAKKRLSPHYWAAFTLSGDWR